MNTILSSIVSAFRASSKKVLSLPEIYAAVNRKQHSIRARIYTNADKFTRVGKGLYILADGTCVHHGIQGDSLEVLPQLRKEGVKPDFVLLDLPYACHGQNGGNRTIADFPVISPEQFGQICKEVSLMVDDTTPVLFIFSNSEYKPTAKLRQQFQDQIEKYFQVAIEGDYTKVYKNGKRCQIMGRLIPTEGLFFYTKSGSLEIDPRDLVLDIEAIRPGRGAYPTEKPLSLLKKIFGQFLEAGKMILDPFAGSASTGKAANDLGIHSILVDLLHNPVNFI